MLRTREGNIESAKVLQQSAHIAFFVASHKGNDYDRFVSPLEFVNSAYFKPFASGLMQGRVIIE